MYLRTRAEDQPTEEYGGRFRRLYPWPGVATPPWGSAVLSVAPGAASEPHAHDEEETFVFLAGRGVVHVGAETRDVGPGDVVYLPPFTRHFVENATAGPLEVLCLWWGAETRAEAAAAAAAKGPGT